ncbi:MAG: enoyl-CoA hydratase/isomerase family protein [Deltaproteobacteria bacterium]|nr:enoyl-CoA hydratase/isomerase family protein [Deltaproteobacteria bacterium]
MIPFKTLMVKEIEPGIALATMNRPGVLNAINMDMLDDFNRLFRELGDDDSIRVLIITGEGRGFSAGADLNDAITHQDSKAFSDPGSFLKIVQESYAGLILGLRKIPQPVIAAVNGPAAGGGFAIALASDIRIATPGAYFVASFINIGLSGGELGSSYFLPRLVGLSNASDILLTGRKLPADEALRMGLVSKVVQKQGLMDEALSYARMMTEKTPGGLTLTKRVLDQNINAPSIEAAIELENRNQTIMVFSGEFFKLIKSFSKDIDQGKKA